MKLFMLPFRLFVKLTHHGFFRRMPDELYLRCLYRGTMGRKLHLNPPVLYSEQLQWLKLDDKNPLYPKLCDKIAVREYVLQRAGGDCLIPLLGVWDDPRDIDFDSLPDRFVLKCTHDSGSIIICLDKSSLDTEDARRAMRKRLSRDYSRLGREWPYHTVPRRVLAERFIGGDDGALPDDYKFYCVRGEVRWICVCTNRREDGTDYVLCDAAFRSFWTYTDLQVQSKQAEMRRPARLAEMIALAERLAEGLAHIRVDLYDMPDGVFFGEITIYDQSGFTYEFDEALDRRLGGMLDLKDGLSRSKP